MDIAGLRFLVVEDHSFQRWVTAAVLKEIGATSVFLAGDGNEALELLASPETRIDIVLTDLDMPAMDGMALIRHMGEMKHRASLVVVSGVERDLLASVEAMAKTFGVAFLGALKKPVSAKRLLNVFTSYRPPVIATESVDNLPITAREISAALSDRQFETFFQPKVHTIDRRIQGAEALVRWRHPTRGLLHPLSFIDAVQRAGFINHLTESVLADATSNCLAWRRAGRDLTVSVNLSPVSLSVGGFADRMIDLVNASGVEPQRIILEITESAAPDLGMKLENLTRLRMRGFGLSIDDFGTGHSSMERLARVPFTELKIDQQFVANASTNSQKRVMLESGLSLASKLGITAVAEGVENHPDWELLIALGCPLAQGYHICRPLHATEFGDWLRTQREASA